MANSALETLSEIFNDKIFKIPDYQRGYSWENEQLEDFWRDLQNLDDKRVHYTGMVTVEHKKENDYYHVVDGQQRLTTIMILLKIILDKFDNNDWIGDENTGALKSELSNKYLFKRVGKDAQTVRVVFGYEKDNPSDIFFRTQILELESTESFSTQTDTLYTKNLHNAKKFFLKKIDKLEKNPLETLVRKITKQLKFNFYEIDKDDELDVSIIFETMNNRGKQLTTLELLKNRLMYLTTILNNDKEEVSQLRFNINEAWKTIYEYIGKDSSSKIEDDVFLKDHWRMYFGKYDRAVANPERDFLLKEHFTIQKVTFRDRENFSQIQEVMDESRLKDFFIDYTDIKDYVFNIQNAIVSYYNMLNPFNTKYSEELKAWLSKINRLGFDTFKPLVMAIMIDKENINDDDEIVRILRLIENYMFIKFRTMKGSNTTIKDFFELAYEYHKKKYIYRIRTKLEDKIYDNHKNKLFKSKKFIDIINDNFDDENKKGWYSWNGIQYLLYEYELFLQSSAQGERKLQWEEINKDSIEHIYPQNTVRECWNEINTLDNKSKKRVLHSLGNLVLLSKTYNSSIGNKCFDVKLEIFSTASYNTIEISQNESWNIDDIYSRGEKLLQFMSDRWNITFQEEDFSKLL